MPAKTQSKDYLGYQSDQWSRMDQARLKLDSRAQHTLDNAQTVKEEGIRLHSACMAEEKESQLQLACRSVMTNARD